MNRVVKISLIIFGINLFLVVLMVVTQKSMDSFVSIGLFWIFTLVVQFFAGVILVLQQRHRQTGQGVLLGALLGLVIGFSLCSVAVH